MKATHITPQGCSVRSQHGEILHRKAYENSAQGREAFLSECAECENINEVLATWGDSPTVVYTPEEQTEEAPTLEQRIETVEGKTDELEEALDLIISGVTE